MVTVEELEHHVTILHKLLEDHLKDDSMANEVLKKHNVEIQDNLEILLEKAESLDLAMKKISDYTKEDIRLLTYIQHNFKALTEKLDSLEQRVKILEVRDTMGLKKL